MKKLLQISLLTLITSPAFAMFCPSNFNQINFGNTIEQVEQQCGKPDTQKTVDAEYTGPQEWSYFVKPVPDAPASFKMTIAFNDNKVINITVNSQSLTSTSACGPTVSLDDSADSVKSACGKPQYVTKGQDASAPASKITTFTYNNPPTTLTFVNGKLTERK